MLGRMGEGCAVGRQRPLRLSGRNKHTSKERRRLEPLIRLLARAPSGPLLPSTHV